MRRARIHAAAVEEAAEAAAWYERERAGLGAEFERAVEAALDLLEEEIVPLVSVPGGAGARGVSRVQRRAFEPAGARGAVANRSADLPIGSTWR